MIRRIYANLEEGLASVLVAALCVIVALQVFYRLVLQAPLSWSEELSTFVFIWVTMIGSSLALKRGEHFAVEILQRNVSPRVGRCFAIIVALLLIIFSSLLVYQGWIFTWSNRNVLTPSLEWSRSVPYSAVVGGGVLMLIRSIEILVHSIRRREVPGS